MVCGVQVTVPENAGLSRAEQIAEQRKKRVMSSDNDAQWLSGDPSPAYCKLNLKTQIFLRLLAERRALRDK